MMSDGLLVEKRPPVVGAQGATCPRRRRERFEGWLAPFLLGVFYAGLVYAALTFRLAPVDVAIIWPANGVAIGVLAFVPRRYWLRYATLLGLATFCGNLSQGVHPLACLGFVVANLVEMLTAAALLKQLSSFSFRDARSMSRGIATACFAAPAVGAAIGAGVTAAVYSADFSQVWQVWFVADVLGNLAFLPFTLVVLTHFWRIAEQPKQLPVPRGLEGALLTSGFLTVAMWIFGTVDPAANAGFRNELMLAPWLMWGALRFPVGSITALNLSLVCVVFGSFLSATGPFAVSAQPPAEALLNAQIYAGTLLTMSLVVGAASYSQRKSQVQLSRRIQQAAALEALAETRAKELWTATTELQDAQVAAEHANQTKSLFLARMSHELRTPLTAMLGFAEVLQERATSAQDVEDLATMRRSGEHLLAVINEILDHAKIEAGRMEIEWRNVRIRDTVREIGELLTLKAQDKNLRLSLRVDANVPEWLRSDPTRLKQLLFNLLGNALKFTEIGEVSLRVVMQGAAPHPMIVFEVSDSGIGMTEQEATRVFEPFQQANVSIYRRHGGTGLGLSISLQIAKLLGGTITVESRLGEGSQFQVVLPYTPATVDERSAAQPARDQAAVSLAAVRILIADDGSDTLRYLQRVLSNQLAEVTCVSNGKLAVEAVAIANQPFDLILMDAQMPVMDGLTAVRELRARGVRTPIAALTADVSQDAHEQALAAGCDAYLTKPISKAALLAAVHELVLPCGSVPQ